MEDPIEPNEKKDRLWRRVLAALIGAAAAKAALTAARRAQAANSRRRPGSVDSLYIKAVWAAITAAAVAGAREFGRGFARRKKQSRPDRAEDAPTDG